jgi:uncharacterized protein
VSVLDLTQADSQSLVFDERVVLPADCGGKDAVAVDGVRLAGSVEKGSRGFLLNGSLEARTTLRCGRCLSEFEFPVSETIELSLVRVDDGPHAEEARLGRDDLEVRFYTEPRLDLVELAGEQIALAVPMKPLCRPDCRGICRRCGANLNEWECTCPRDAEVDSRLAPLLGWRRGKEK